MSLMKPETQTNQNYIQPNSNFNDFNDSDDESISGLTTDGCAVYPENNIKINIDDLTTEAFSNGSLKCNNEIAKNDYVNYENKLNDQNSNNKVNDLVNSTGIVSGNDFLVVNAANSLKIHDENQEKKTQEDELSSSGSETYLLKNSNNASKCSPTVINDNCNKNNTRSDVLMTSYPEENSNVDIPNFFPEINKAVPNCEGHLVDNDNEILLNNQIEINVDDSSDKNNMIVSVPENTVNIISCSSDEYDSDEEDSYNLKTDGQVISPDETSQVPAIPGMSFGAVNVENSSDVQFGNRTYYQGPVTIKQIVYPKINDREFFENDVKCLKQDSDVESGYRTAPSDNPVFDNLSVNEPWDCAKKSETNVHNDKDPSIHRKVIKYRRLLVSLFAIVMLICVLLGVFLITRDTSTGSPTYTYNDSEQDSRIPKEGIGEYKNLSLSDKLRMVSRLEWVAQPALEQNPLKKPVPLVIIHHTATDNCTVQSACVFLVREIQNFHIESRGWSDIAYNFLVGGDGHAYVGRGWDLIGAHKQGYNAQSIGIAMIGTFVQIKPPQRQFDAVKKLIQMGIDNGTIDKNYKLVAVSQLGGTTSPGKYAFDEISTWDHWSEKP